MTRSFRQRLLAAVSSGYLWIFLAALALRWVYLWQALRSNELLTYPVVDARVYVDWAHDILAGKWLWYESKTYTPGMPAWLAGWFAILGERPWLHFAGFHLLGAVQAVLLGKTAEVFWNRFVGQVTGWLAALYWPLIIFEASYYAEPLAIFSLTVTFYLLARWSEQPSGWRTLLAGPPPTEEAAKKRKSGGVGKLLGAGFALGIAILVRSNTMLCAPVLALWVAVTVWPAAKKAGQNPWRCLSGAVALLALPSLLLCAPVLFWNWKVNGVAELRSGAWLSVYLGNNPEYRGLVVPVGVRYNHFVYQPIRAGAVERADQNRFWRDQVMRVIREQPGTWAALLARKALMLVGRFEISQEIDIGVFRSSSSTLSLPWWPGWAFVFPLAVVAGAAMIWASNARDGWPLLAFALIYLCSVAPVQAAARYRLPVVVALLPMAGRALTEILALAARREKGALALLALPAVLAGVLAWPDWLGLGHEKIINHPFLVGLKREEAGDDPGAERAFQQGATWNPQDPDCPYRLGQIALRRKQPGEAETYFQRALGLFPPSYEAILGLAECDLATQHFDEALRHVDQALSIAPGNRDALALKIPIFTAKGDWIEVANTCNEMSAGTQYPAATGFIQVRALSLAGQSKNALAVLDDIAARPWHTATERARAAYLAGLLAWHLPGGRSEALARWQKLAAGPTSFFALLAQLLTAQISPEALHAALPANTADEPHLRFALAAAAVQKRDVPAAIAHLEALVARRHAADLPLAERDLLEIWALEDLSHLPKKP